MFNKCKICNCTVKIKKLRPMNTQNADVLVCINEEKCKKQQNMYKPPTDDGEEMLREIGTLIFQ